MRPEPRTCAHWAGRSGRLAKLQLGAFPSSAPADSILIALGLGFCFTCAELVKLSYLATLIGSCLLLLLTACSSFSGTHGLAGSGMIPPAGIRAIEETKTKLA